MKQLEVGWGVYESKEIRKKYLFTKYTNAIIFTNKIAELSEKESRHPFIHIDYKKVTIILFTHKINVRIVRIIITHEKKIITEFWRDTFIIE